LRKTGVIKYHQIIKYYQNCLYTNATKGGVEHIKLYSGMERQDEVVTPIKPETISWLLSNWKSPREYDTGHMSVLCKNWKIKR